MKAPAEIDDQVLVLMADIFPIRFFGARNAFSMLQPLPANEATVVVIGFGPVGLCPIMTALEHRPKHHFVIDSSESRLELARKLGVRATQLPQG